MDNIPQIFKRRIGQVDVLDFRGAFTGPWALRGQDEMARYIESRSINKIMMNLKGMTTVDSLGVRAISESISKVQGKSAILNGNLTVMDMFQRAQGSDLNFLANDKEALEYFGQDFIGDTKEMEDDRRVHSRLKTAFPLEFVVDKPDGSKLFFHAIVTDVSEGGLLAEYLDLEEASFGEVTIDPLNSQLIDMKLFLPNGSMIEVKGKVVRTAFDANQVGIGIEFCDISTAKKDALLQFLKQ